MFVVRAAFAVVVLVHLAAQLVAPESTVAELTQPLLMPALAAVLVAETSPPRSRLVRVTFVALFFSWLGDTLPRFVSGDAAFLLMVGCFLLAQVAYVVALWPTRDSSVLRRPALLAPYLLALVVLLLLCREGAGALLVPVVVYGVALAAMAVLSTGLGRVAAIGGAVFMLSDSLIALEGAQLKDTKSLAYVVATPKDGVQGMFDRSVGTSKWGVLRVTAPAAPWQRRVFNGWAQVIVQSTGQAGDASLTAKSSGLAPATIRFQTGQAAR
jgi:uncharacterized membrane protein YhhN